MTDLPAVDLIEGRRLLDAYERGEDVPWYLWCDQNAEAMLTLLEQARRVLEIFDRDERNERGEQTYIESEDDLKELARLGASIYRALTTTEKEA